MCVLRIMSLRKSTGSRTKQQDSRTSERRASASSSFLVRRKSNEPARYSQRTNPAHYSNQIHPARAAAWHRARPIPNCHLKRAPDSPPLVPAVCLTPVPPEPDKNEGPPDRCGAVRCCSILRRTPTTIMPPPAARGAATPHYWPVTEICS